MRTFLILAMFTASLAQAAWSDYEETRELTLDASGIDTLDIDAGSGSMQIEGVEGAREIRVIARIQVPGKDEEKAQETITKKLKLSLDNKGDKAVLKSFFEESAFGWGDSPSVALEISVPVSISLVVDDSSGSIQIRDVAGDIAIDDSSGSIRMSDVGGNVKIDDSSGSITVERVGADISIDDGSGSITVSDVIGSVIVDDGSGSVKVKNVGKDLIIKDDGSGSIRYSNIQGTVEDNS